MNLDDIETFNKRFNDPKWLSGDCYYYAVILQSKFGGKICYDPIKGHFFVKIDNNCFDFNGVYTPTTCLDFESLKESDPIWVERLERDCM